MRLEKTEISVGRFPPWLGMWASKFYDWRRRCGRSDLTSWLTSGPYGLRPQSKSSRVPTQRE
jgi:hypothetical protein